MREAGKEGGRESGHAALLGGQSCPNHIMKLFDESGENCAEEDSSGFEVKFDMHQMIQ